MAEYYLLDTLGSFLFLSETEEANALFAFNEGVLEFQEDRVPEADRNTDLAKEIYFKKQDICFHPFNILKKYDSGNWKNYLQPLNRLESESPVFYACVPDLANLNQSKIVSFSRERAALETRKIIILSTLFLEPYPTSHANKSRPWTLGKTD